MKAHIVHSESHTRKVATRITSSTDPLSIRGAARPTAVGRIRRNALSLPGSARPNTPPVSMTVKALDVWREFVKKRWNRESRFLDLEVSLGRVRDRSDHFGLTRTLQRMAHDDTLRKHNIAAPGAHGASGKEASVIFKLASQLQPEVGNSLSYLQLKFLSIMRTPSLPSPRFKPYLSQIITLATPISSALFHIFYPNSRISHCRTTTFAHGRTSTTSPGEKTN